MKKWFNFGELSLRWDCYKWRKWIITGTKVDCIDLKSFKIRCQEANLNYFSLDPVRQSWEIFYWNLMWSMNFGPDRKSCWNYGVERKIGPKSRPPNNNSRLKIYVDIHTNNLADTTSTKIMMTEIVPKNRKIIKLHIIYVHLVFWPNQ